MGNTGDAAEAHYIQEQKEFRQTAALKPTTETKIEENTQGDSENTTDTKSKKVVQNPVQKIEELARTRQKANVLGVGGNP